MIITLSSKNNEKTFSDKEIINIGSNAGCDFVVDIGADFLLTLQCDPAGKKCVILNSFNNQNILFKGKPLAQMTEVDKVCKLMSGLNDEFISIKIIEQQSSGNYEVGVIEQKKAELEKARVGVIKKTGFVINDLRTKLTLNSRTSIFLHIVLALTSMITSFGVANYLTGLRIEDTRDFIHLPMNIKILFLFTAVIYALCLILKQGVYLYFQNKLNNIFNFFSSVSFRKSLREIISFFTTL